MRPSKMRALAIVTASALLIIDRLTKGYFLAHLIQQVQLIPNVLWLQYHLNDQMALSLPLFPLFYYTLVAGVIIALGIKLVSLWKEGKSWLLLVIAVILAGAISNLLDRMLYGGVVDFITVSLGSVFNIADIMIVGGVVSWVIILSYGDRPKTV